MVYAKIDSGVVVDLVVVGPDDIASLPNAFTWVDTTGKACLDGSNIAIGATYDGSNFTSLPRDSFNRYVTMSTDGVNDTYTVYDDSLGQGATFNVQVAYLTSRSDAYTQINTYVPNLAKLKQDKMIDFRDAIAAYTDNVFDIRTRLAFLCMYVSATASGKLNRVAYLAPLFTWLDSIISYAVTFSGQVNASSDAATLSALTWDLTQISSPPAITLMGAISIPD